MTCEIRRCDDAATVRVIVDRPRPGTAGSPLPSDYVCWHGHFDHAYCQSHALTFVGTTAEYGDVITMRPVPESAVTGREDAS